MAFTFSHPAAIVFLPKKYFETSALIIGSMIPDIGYFIPLVDIHRTILHQTLWSLCLIPTGLLIFYIFHFHVKRTVFQFIPKKIQLKFEDIPKEKYFSGRRIIKITLSIIIGISSHLLWDGISHHEDFGPQLFPFLENIAYQSSHGTIRIYHLIQYYSSAIGLLVMFFYIINRLSAKKAYFKNNQPDYRYKIFSALLISLLNLIYMGILFFYDIHHLENKPWIVRVAVGCFTLNFLLFWLLSILNSGNKQINKN